MKNYIKLIRKKVGHQNIFLNFVVGIIFNSKGDILLQKRGDSLKWGLPGGAVELGESFDQAARREVFEETGLTIDIKDLLGIYSGKKYHEIRSNSDETQPVVVAFYATANSGNLNVTGDETVELKYFNENKLPKIHNQQHTDIINDAFKHLSGVYK